MRKRRLYRNSMAQSFNPRRLDSREAHEQKPTDPQQLAFESGLRHGMMISSMQQRQMVQAAQQHALALASHSEARIARARQESFDRGYTAGMKASAPPPQEPKSSSGTYTYADLQAARERGFQAGRKLSESATATEKSSIRKKIVDEMIEQCRIISESNPNMAPGVNAVRHRIKKLY